MSKVFGNSITKFTDVLTKELQNVVGGTEQGMQDAVRIIADEAARITPVLTGNFLASQYTEVQVHPGKIVGIVGYDKEGKYPYGVYQHEIPYREGPNYDASTKGNPNAEDKFLAKAFDRKGGEAIQAILKRNRTK